MSDDVRRELDRLRLENEDLSRRLASLDARRSAEEEEQAHFFELSVDLICIAGVDGRLKRVSPSWTKVLGWTEEELLARPSIDFVHPDDRASTLRARTQLTEGVVLESLTNRYLCKDGGHRWIDWRSVPAGRGLFYCVARDITAQREAEHTKELLQKQLMMADRMMSVGTLAAGVAHEINNPLSYVISNLETMAEELQALSTAPHAPGVTELEAMLRDARQGAERVKKTVRALSTFSRNDDEHRVVMDVRPPLEMAVNMAFNEIRHRARLVKDFGPTPLVDADEARLGQVFVNLLVNAAHAIPAGDADANEICIVTSTDREGRAIIEVRDTGSGMSDEVLGRIFEPFFTTKPVGVGTGLGLSICHNIVTALHGRISAHSEVGRGTTMRVELPASLAARAPVPAPVRASVGTHPSVERRAAVLVVDDEPAIGTALRRVLRDHDVTVLSTAHQAIELLAAGRCYDVIFSDLMMPQMTGQELHDEILHRWPEQAARVVFITGGAFTPAATEFLERVENERIMKPFSPERVRAVVRRFTPAAA